MHALRTDPTQAEAPAARAAASLAIAFLIAAALLPAAGCSGAKKPVKKPRAATAGVDDAAAAETDAAAPEGVDPDTALVVDGGKVAVCSPTGWTRGPQSKDYLVKYVPGRRKTYPSIVVLAADAPEGLPEVDADSHKQFVAAIATSLAGTYSKDGKSTLLKKPAALKLGPHLGATWAAPATVKVDGVRESIDRTSYALVLGGRMYTVEVRAPKGKLDEEGRALARAVAAAIAPPAAEAAAEPAAAETPPPEESGEKAAE